MLEQSVKQMKAEMPNVHCPLIQKSLFVSHRGVGLCCASRNHWKNVLPTEFWNGDTRRKALDNMNNSVPVDGCEGCYATEMKKIPSHRNFALSYDNMPIKKLPTMIDVDFSNFCNLKCVMCYPVRSSQWAKEAWGNDGISKLATQYIDDLLSICDEVEFITFNGGEPSLMPEYEYFLQKLQQKGLAQQIELQVITNATNINKKFYDQLKEFNKVRLSISVDAYGHANNFIRYPSNFEQISKNIKEIAEMPGKFKVEILSSINILSMFDYHKLLEWCASMETVYESKNKKFKFMPMKVENPKKYSPFSAPVELKTKFIEDVQKFLKQGNLSHSPNCKTELMLLCKAIKDSKVDDQAIADLKHTIEQFNQQKTKNIRDYIPEFYNYF